MSYEGYVQHLCAKGHRFDADAYDHNPHCIHCESEPVWSNSVDDTNCDEYGVIPDLMWEKLQLTEEKREACNLGHLHVTEEATYRVPTEEETLTMRHFRHDDGVEYTYQKLTS